MDYRRSSQFLRRAVRGQPHHRPASTPISACTSSSAASSSWTSRWRRSRRSARPSPCCCPSRAATRTPRRSTGSASPSRFIGAAMFSTIRSKRARIPQEAIIGICYAVASAASILAMSKATARGEHLKDMLVGNILSVSWPEVWKTALLYGAIGLFHFVFRRQFLAISMDPAAAEARGSRSGSGTSSSTRRSASSSPRRWRSPACCWCSAT